MTEYHFIVNRESSGGACLRKWEEAECYLNKKQIPYAVHFPENEEETVSLVRELTAPEQPECHLIIIGADGTLNAALQGIVCFEKTCFSCLAGGSANDFARDMDLSHDTEEALDAILHTPRERFLDYGELVCRREGSKAPFWHRFLISSGIGYDAHICAIAAKSPVKRLFGRLGLGSLIYVSIGVFLMFTGKYGRARIRIDDGETFEIPHFIFTAMIHKYEGGGIAFCPDADPEDGFLDLCIVRQMPVFRKLPAFLLVLKEKHGRLPQVSILRCKNVHIRTSRPEWIHMDGETPFKTNEIRYTVKNGLRFIY
jgi:YegS/Rv2252/BmrU family lipid kinase